MRNHKNMRETLLGGLSHFFRDWTKILCTFLIKNLDLNGQMLMYFRNNSEITVILSNWK